MKMSKMATGLQGAVIAYLQTIDFDPADRAQYDDLLVATMGVWATLAGASELSRGTIREYGQMGIDAALVAQEVYEKRVK